MIIDKVTSRQNPLVKRFRSVSQGRERHLIFIEGVRLIEEALRSELHIETIAYTDRLLSSERGAQLWESFKKLPCRGALVTESVMAAISDLESPQGAAAIARLPYAALEDAIVNEKPLLVIAHRLQDPGNLGTMIRTAEAAGADSFISTQGTVDPFNLKSLRASMGSAFRLPIISNVKLSAVAQHCLKSGLKLVAADPKGEKKHNEYDWAEPTALLLGQEGEGLDEDAERFVEERLSIPMARSVESLNVSVACAVMLFEAARQRLFKI